MLIYHTGSKSPLRIEFSPGKGFGLFATRRIHQGELVFQERPTLMIGDLSEDLDWIQANETIGHHFNTLDDPDREEFLSLANSFPERPILVSIVNSNAFLIEPNYDAVFFKLSRIIHSCKPNIHYVWYEEDGLFKLHALRDISANEEVFISYINTYQSWNQRRTKLKDGFNFTCTCELCSAKMTKEQRERSDRNLDLIDTWTSKSFRNAEKALKLMRRLFQAASEEGLADDVFLMGHLNLKFVKYLLKFEPNSQLVEEMKRYALSNLTMAFGVGQARKIFETWVQ